MYPAAAFAARPPWAVRLLSRIPCFCGRMAAERPPGGRPGPARLRFREGGIGKNLERPRLDPAPAVPPRLNARPVLRAPEDPDLGAGYPIPNKAAARFLLHRWLANRESA